MSLSGKGMKRWRKEDYQNWEGVYTEARICALSGKYCHSKEEAFAEKLRQEERWGIKLGIYLCKMCSTFHLTSKT